MISNSSYEMARSSSSFQTSKHQTPIKSPSPDQTRMNALTPTQVKYIINGKNVKGYDLGIAYESCNQTPMRIQNQKEEYKRSRRSEKQSQVFKLKPQCGCHDHMKQLQKQVQILQIQNRNLLRKMAIQKQNQLTTSYPHQYCTQPRQSSNQQLTLPTSPSNVNLPSNIQLHRRGTSQIIDKIKQQYEQKINTLKLMVEQQVKQAIGVIEDMCQIFKNNLQKIEERIDSIQFKLKDVKIKRILQIQNYFNKSTRTDGHNKQLCSNLNGQIIVQNSLSDILCVSIPQESQEQSKNYTTTIGKLQQQIQLLRKAINQTSKSYNDQKSSLRQIINQKNEQINKLTHQLNKSQQIKQSFQWKYNKSIKEELILLQKNVEEIAQELISSETQCQNLTQFLDQKNKICENLQRQLAQLKDKMFNGEKHKVFLQQKVRYLQGNISILQQELKQTKVQLNQAIVSRMNLQKQRITKITNQTHRSSIQLNVLTLTSRIDKLLMLEQQRQLKQKKAFFGDYMTMQSIQKSFRSKNNHRQYEESNQIAVEDFSKGDETMMRSQR